jgi:cytoskeletal protein CcmA (bactofilin family)
MFNKNMSDGGISDKKDIETIIGASVKVEGNFTCEGNMVIDGQVKGNVQTNGFLQIGKNAVVVADVKAANAHISGEVRGNVTIDGFLELGDSAKIIGDLQVAFLSVAKGSLINGRCTMGKDQPVTKPVKNNIESEEETEA